MQWIDNLQKLAVWLMGLGSAFGCIAVLAIGLPLGELFSIVLAFVAVAVAAFMSLSAVGIMVYIFLYFGG